MKRIVLGAGLLLAATAATAQMAPTASAPPPDGVQTRAQVVERTRAMFARIDTNRDGFITAEEGRAARAQMAQRRPGQRMARAGNAANGGSMMFERLDTNRDNVISRDEWTRAQQTRAARVAQRGQAPGGNSAVQRMEWRGAMLRQADANGDGRISLAEAEAAALRRFATADLNRDGRVTREERQTARQNMRQRGIEGSAPTPVR